MRKGLIILIISMLLCFPTIFSSISLGYRYEKNTSLANVDGSFIGENVDSQSGWISKQFGDFNGDKISDVLIGASRDNEHGTLTGQIYLIFGKKSDWNNNESLSNADVSFHGEYPHDYAGLSITSAGDVNGDGIDDILIGADQYDGNGTRKGKIYLIFGKKDNWGNNINLSNSDASFIGEYDRDSAGDPVTAAGDINGDGFSDILIGAFNNDEGGTSAGKSYLLFGKADGWSNNVNLSFADVSFVGENARDGSGFSVSNAGDVNGDGFDDLLIGAPNNDEGMEDGGQVYLIFGRKSFSNTTILLSNANASYLGVDDKGDAGYSIASAGDVNNDGYDDFLIGDPKSGRHATGTVYLIFGKSSGWNVDVRLNNADVILYGENEEDSAGYCVNGVGDVNGDGYSDFVIGAPFNSDFGILTGKSYLFYGKEVFKNSIQLSEAQVSFNGVRNVSVSGMSIGGNGDINGDGYDDLLIGVPTGFESARGISYVVFPEISTRPSSIHTLKVYSDENYSEEISEAWIYQTIYVEIFGMDSNSSRADVALVDVRTEFTSPNGFIVRMFETGLNTGVFRTELEVRRITNKQNAWIGGVSGERIFITSVKDPIKEKSITIRYPSIHFVTNNTIAIEDEEYNEYLYLWTENVKNVFWSLSTNASWVSWSPDTHNISGIPNNGDVGIHRLNIMLKDIYGVVDEQALNLTVLNTPPNILTEDNLTGKEDEEYFVDYDSDDDDQGNITWYLQTDAKWLSMNISTGILTGIPIYSDVNSFWLNVSVDDGNGGWDWSNFTLTVIDINDPPEITTRDNTEAIEDIEYFKHYKAIDPDVNDTTFEWDLETNADWLTLNKTIGVLKGTPDNTDVGVSYVNISVRDSGNAFDFHNYTLKVHNAPPMILTMNVMNATEDQEYLVDYDSDDDEQGGVGWGIETEAKWLSINSSTGVLEGTPRNKDVGLEFVMLWADDGYDTGYSNFYIEVVNTNDPPSILSDPPLEATVDTEYQYKVNFIDIDPEEHGRLLLLKGPAGMRISNGNIISWTPQKGQEGPHEVLIEAIDASSATDNQTYEILVHPHLNVTIAKPIEGQNVSGKLKVRGTVIGPDDVQVEINLDNSSWIEVQGNESWIYLIGSKKLENGNHTIKVRATWGDYKSENATVTFLVDNPVETKEEDNGWIMWIVILLLFIMALALLARGMRREQRT